METSFFAPFQKEFSAIGEWLNNEFQSVRTGRATPAFIDHISVEVYGARGPLLQFASITVADPRTLMIQPWDPQTVKDIEKGLTLADRGFTVVPDKTSLRVMLPTMTEQNRKELVKIINEKCEQAKTKLRQLRDRIREQIQRQEREKAITQDDRYRLQKDLDELTAKTQEQIVATTKKKESDIMTI